MFGDHEAPHAAVLAVRYVLPAVLVAAGVVVWAAASSEEMVGLGMALIGAAGLVVIANLYIRLSIASNADREHETRRREARAQMIDGSRGAGVQAEDQTPPRARRPQ
jgi:hypothetical protein